MEWYEGRAELTVKSGTDYGPVLKKAQELYNEQDDDFDVCSLGVYDLWVYSWHGYMSRNSIDEIDEFLEYLSQYCIEGTCVAAETRYENNEEFLTFGAAAACKNAKSSYYVGKAEELLKYITPHDLRALAQHCLDKAEEKE